MHARRPQRRKVQKQAAELMMGGVTGEICSYPIERMLYFAGCDGANVGNAYYEIGELVYDCESKEASWRESVEMRLSTTNQLRHLALLGWLHSLTTHSPLLVYSVSQLHLLEGSSTLFGSFLSMICLSLSLPHFQLASCNLLTLLLLE